MNERARIFGGILAVVLLAVSPLRSGVAQGRPDSSATSAMREASRLDLAGRTAEARVLMQRMLDSANTPAAKAAIQRAMAMSYAFDGDCANTVKYEEMVIGYWETREQLEPQNAFYQEGEMANEAARVCIDAGDLATSEKWYRRGYELGLKEPAPKTHPRSLWDFRLAHALGRLAARRGDSAEATRQIADARHRNARERERPLHALSPGDDVRANGTHGGGERDVPKGV